ncbi:MAG: hypothetical protein EOO24_67500, partial [Comamonadaceae bacterium]
MASCHGFVRLDRIVEPLAPPPFGFRSGDAASVDRSPHIGVEYEGVGGTISPPMLQPAVPPRGPEVPVTPAQPQPPTLVAPGPQVVAEDGELVFGGGTGNPIVVADLDSPTLTTNLQVSTGTLHLPRVDGVTVTGDGTGTIVLVGTPEAINRALDGLIYRPLPDDTRDATLTVTTGDGTHTVGSTVQVGVTPMPDAPVGTDDSVSTPEGIVIRVPVGTLLANDS